MKDRLTIEDLVGIRNSMPRLPRLVQNKWIPKGQAYLFNDGGEKPEDWDTMADEEKLRYAVDNGWVVMVKGL